MIEDTSVQDASSCAPAKRDAQHAMRSERLGGTMKMQALTRRRPVEAVRVRKGVLRGWGRGGARPWGSSGATNLVRRCWRWLRLRGMSVVCAVVDSSGHLRWGGHGVAVAVVVTKQSKERLAKERD